MPKARKRSYEVEHRKFATWGAATAFAVGLSLDRGEDVTITEYGLTGTYYITVAAQSEKVE